MEKTGRAISLVFFLTSFFWGFPGSVHAKQRGLDVFVIAHSISTSREAREVRRRQGWNEVSDPKKADAVLVVCRSGMSYPLNSSYRNLKELDRDAESQLNMSGDNFHVYLFRFNSRSGLDEVKHLKYRAED